MSKLLIAKPIVDNSLEMLKEKSKLFKNSGLVPKMGVILVGENQASLRYIRNKQKMCQKVGADFKLIQLPENTTVSDFLDTVSELNTDDSFTGCFIQLPVPKQLQGIDLASAISPDKDIDGFHANSSVSLYRNTKDSFVPCTPKGILKMFAHYNIDPKGKNIVVIGRSYIVGKPLSLLLSNEDATVTLCHSQTKNLTDHTKRADIIVSAVGNPKYINKNYINKDKDQIIIDVGINLDQDGKLCGDVDFDDIHNDVAAITPVPGSIGPLTVLSLIENLFIATENILKKRQI